MFLAIVFIILGLFLLLNAMGIIAGNFWGWFWAIIFLAIGIRMLIGRGKCPMCSSQWCAGRIHEKMHDDCECECGHDHGGHEQE